MDGFNINRELHDIFARARGDSPEPKPDLLTRAENSEPGTDPVTDTPLPEGGGESPSMYYARLARSTHADLVSDGADTYALEELMVYMALSIKNRLAEGVWPDAIDTIRRIEG
jgi:hypothetical protein